jgi:predicted permease
MILLSGAGVLVRSFVAIVGADTGLSDPDHVVVGRLRLPSDRYPTAESRLAYLDRVEARLRAHPGLEAITTASVKPIRGVTPRRFVVDGRPPLRDGDETVQAIGVGPDYFRTLAVSPLDGRTFRPTDRAETRPVAIVNLRFADQHWPGRSPLGSRVRLASGEGVSDWRTVVGVVPNIMQGDALRQEFRPLIYLPLHQDPPARTVYLMARTTGRAAAQMAAIRAAARSVDPAVALEDFMTLTAGLAFERDFMDAQHSELGKYSAVAPVFAALALVLAATGLIAVVTHAVSQRTREIGVRIAIGAMARDINRMVVREGLRPVALGLALGVTGAFAVNRLLQSQLVGVSPYDPLTMAGAPVVLLVVALLACQFPARRAMRVDPVIALRHE